MNENADKQLVISCLSGDTAAFEQIVRKYQKTIFNLVYHMTHDFDHAEDLTQSVFVKVYENLDRYNTNYKFYSWIYRIAVNESLNFIKRQKKNETLPEGIESTSEKADRHADNDELQQSINYALGELEPEYRILIIMRHFLDYSYHDISQTLQIPEKTVKSRLYSARQTLARILTKKGMQTNG
jgi:RNA polymerase sigma-70 factor (ECF subfamily)